MEGKIIKSFDRNITPTQLRTGTHTINFCSWNRLQQYLALAAGCEPEKVQGVRAGDEGLEIILTD